LATFALSADEEVDTEVTMMGAEFLGFLCDLTGQFTSGADDKSADGTARERPCRLSSHWFISWTPCVNNGLRCVRFDGL
jgi:hypothetical protein